MKLKAFASTKLDRALLVVGCGVCGIGLIVFGFVLLFTCLDDFVIVWRTDYHEVSSLIAYGTWYPSIQGSVEVESEMDRAELGRFNLSDRHIHVFRRAGLMSFPASAFRLHLAWPLLGFAVPLLIMAGRRAVRWRRSRRRAATGHCWRCGYDLTKNESGRCPECGVECGQSPVNTSAVKNEAGDESEVRPLEG